MWEKNRQINSAEPAREIRHALRTDLTDAVVIDQVEHKECRGGDQRGDHQVRVRPDALSANHHVGDDEEDRADAVERRVDGGEIGKRHGWRFPSTAGAVEGPEVAAGSPPASAVASVASFFIDSGSPK